MLSALKIGPQLQSTILPGYFRPQWLILRALWEEQILMVLERVRIQTIIPHGMMMMHGRTFFLIRCATFFPFRKIYPAFHVYSVCGPSNTNTSLENIAFCGIK